MKKVSIIILLATFIVAVVSVVTVVVPTEAEPVAESESIKTESVETEVAEVTYEDLLDVGLMVPMTGSSACDSDTDAWCTHDCPNCPKGKSCDFSINKCKKYGGSGF